MALLCAQLPVAALSAQPSSAQEEVTAFTQVRIVDVATGRLLPGRQVVVVRGARITEIGRELQTLWEGAVDNYPDVDLVGQAERLQHRH